MSDPPDLAAIVGLLEDEHARTILEATSEEPMSVTELAETCDVATSTAYRRVERLREADLLTERTRPRADGHHDQVYVATLESVEIRLRDGEFRHEVERRKSDDMADQLTRLWEHF